MGASNFTNSVDNIFLFILAISVVLLLGITFTMIYFVYRYNHKRNPRATDISGNVLLEVVWTILPLFLVMGIFYYGYVDYKKIRKFPKDAFEVEVTGRMWSWIFSYPNGVQTDTLFLPIDKPIILNLKSIDVIHSFYVPAFRLKMDAVPGQDTRMWFKIEEAGEYQAFCAEYCGDRHSYMLSQVVGLPTPEFEQWYKAASADLAPPKEKAEEMIASTAESAPAPASPSLKLGERLVSIKGCASCHSLDGSRIVGPTFKGIFGKKETVLVSGKEEEIVVDEAYLRESILDPNTKVVKGYQPIMPPMRGQISDEEIEAIIEYLKSVK